MANEIKLPEWHNPGIEPPQRIKQNGWVGGEKPAYQYMNWQFHQTYQSLVNFRDSQQQMESAFTEQLAQIAIRIEDFPRLTIEVEDAPRIQRAIDYAAERGLHLTGSPNAEYTVNSIRIKNGLKSFICRGVIKGRGTSQNGVIQIDGVNRFSGETVKNCVISVNVDMSAGDTHGIYADGIENCIIENCRVYGFTDNSSAKYGIYLHHNSKFNIIRNNYLQGALKPTGGYQFMIVAIGNSIAWGGYFDGVGGVVTRATMPIAENQIYNNICLNGTHGIVLNAGERNSITNNVCKYNSHRAITLEPVCFNNNVMNNQLIGYGSAAVIVAYGSSDNLIANNDCVDGDLSVMPADGEGSITVYVGCRRNKIIGNKIDSQRRFGVYLAIDAIDNIVELNEVKGYRLAAVALENDWIPSGSPSDIRDPLPVNAKFSRPNYSQPPLNSNGVRANKWAFNDSIGNVIQNNVLHAGTSASSAAIYLAQIGDNTSLKTNTIQVNNIKNMPTNCYYLYVFEEITNKCTDNILTNNNFIGGAAITSAKFYLSRGRLHFSNFKDNDFLNTSTVIFPPVETTPSVSFGKDFRLNNAVATSVTNFLGASEGQEILIRLDGFTTLVHNNSIMRLKGNANVTPTSSNNFITLKNITGIWFEIFRNF